MSAKKRHRKYKLDSKGVLKFAIYLCFVCILLELYFLVRLLILETIKKVIYLLTTSVDNNLTGMLKEINSTSYAESRFGFYNNIIRLTFDVRFNFLFNFYRKQNHKIIFILI